MSSRPYTIHGVLAGAYAGKVPKLDRTLTHASLDRGDTAICGRVRPGNLCDLEEPELTCPTCIRKVARLSGAAPKRSRD